MYALSTAEHPDMELAAELTSLATRAMSGRMDVVSDRVTGQIWLRDGRVCTVSLAQSTPALGMRLVSGGKLSLNSLGSALATQRQNPHMRLGDVLVRMGLVSRADVEAVAWEQMCDDMTTLLEPAEAVHTFTAVPGVQCPPPGPTVDELLAAVRTRAAARREVIRQVGGADVVPELSHTVLHAHDVALRPEEWAVLCRVDGRRTLTSIASQAGFTILEAASMLQSLIAAELVVVPMVAPLVTPPAPAAPAAPANDWGSAGQTFDDPSELLRELSELGGATSTGRWRT